MNKKEHKALEVSMRDTVKESKESRAELRRYKREVAKREAKDDAFDRLLANRNGKAGVCCRTFRIPIAPEDVKKEIATINNESMLGIFTPRHSRNTAAMLFPLLKHLYSSNKQGHWYTCRAFDQKTGKCEIQDCKPSICTLYKPVHSFCVNTVKCKSWKWCKKAAELTSNELRSGAEKTHL